ncbi:protein kinase domain-containing protein [Streptacidiphilus sp. PAMC 29251]
MATEYIPGLSLSATVAEHGTLDLAATWRLAADLGQAVSAMAEAAVVHRDIKPSNVILGPDGCRVIDFGISQAGDRSSITLTGQQVGTPAYMSPEQVRGLPVGTPSDIFALGSVLAYALTGNAPFGDGTSVDVLHRVAYEPPKEEVLERIAGIDPDLAELVTSCLDKDQQRRPGPEAVMETAATRQVPAPWPQALNDAVQSRIQIAASVRQLPLDLVPVEETVVLGRGAVPAPAAEPRAEPAAEPRAEPAAEPVLPPTPLQGPHQPPTPPTVAAIPAPMAPYLPPPVAVPPVPAAPPRETRAGRRGARTWTLVAGAVLAVAAIAGTAVLLTGSPGGSAAAVGTAGTTAATSSATTDPSSASASTPTSTTAVSAPPSAGNHPSAPANSTPGQQPPATGAAKTSGAAAPTPPAAHQPQPPAATTAAPPPAPHTSAPATKAVPPWDQACTYYSGNAETEYGAANVRVTELQCLLVHRGYSVGSSGVDGQFGKDTENAVKKFQTAKHLEVDGQVGPQTWAALRSAN